MTLPILHCFPYAGSGKLAFRAWPGHLESVAVVQPFQLPGREDRFGERFLTRFPEAVAHVLDTWQQPADTPFALYGHSMGALLAVAVARELRRRGGPQPIRLFLSGMDAPRRLRLSERAVHRLPDDELLDYLRQLGGIGDDVLRDPYYRRAFLPIVRADFALAQTYEHGAGEPLRCPISVWGGADDISTTAAGLAAWREETTSDFMLRTLPGTHLFIDTGRSELIASLVKDLDQTAR